MTSTLTDRYVLTAMRTVPEKQRADLAAELRGSIDDQIEARLEQGESPEGAERAVLTALGDPEKLAAGYTDRPLQLIGPRYYLSWWRLLKLLWAIVPACAAGGVALGMTLAGEPAGGIIGDTIAVALSVIVHVAFWTTFVFVIIERVGTGSRGDSLSEWTLDDLPEAPERGSGLGDLIASIAALAVAAGALLWDRFVGFVIFADSDGPVSFLDPSLWPWPIALLFVLIALEVLHAIWIYAKGGWTTSAAVANVALNLAIAVPALVLLLQQRLLNPEFFPTVLRDGDAGDTVQAVVATLFGFGIAAIAVWDGIDGFRKARRRGSAGR